MKTRILAHLSALAVPAALAALAAGCARGAAVPDVRFANSPAVAAVDDRKDVPARPAVRGFNRYLYHFDGSFYRLITRKLELPRQRRALGVNALDEVPDSTWFTNRIGVRDLSPDEVRRGPATVGSPEPHKPWTIHSTKVGGASIGFIITDARGEKFVLKFDRAGHPETETAADVITGRLLWAAGYNVPEDHVVYLRPEDLVLAPDAKIKDWSGERGRLERPMLERALARIVHEPDGRIRALASHMLEGKPIGGHSAEGVRKDDPNDRIPHELRRDLRGAYVFYSWLDQTDVKEDNSLDMWVTDPADPKRHYVKHYLIDFGTSLGGAAAFYPDLRMGYAHMVDFPGLFTELVTLGLRERPWERRESPGLRGVGVFDGATFRPELWKAETPQYLPFRVADDHDKLWASKILMRFTREQLRAAVESARLSDPRATDYLTETLVTRQRIAARHWFSQKPPLDHFEPAASGRALCFDDLLLTYRLAPVAGATRYTIAAYDRGGRPVGPPRELSADGSGRACAPVALAAERDAYTIVRIDTRRNQPVGATYVHLARDPATGAPRVIGVWRP
jgi:hypothetical protein